ncbi:hypothetical protein [Oerskovia jenensis]|uniref:hypothetical protein n=1 Tax=Oerskovia jenensis TaxID=162169 RepID=UPI0036DEC1FA
MDDDVVGAADEGAAWLDAWGDRTDYEVMGVPELARAYVEHLVDLRGDRAARLRALDAIGVHDEVFSRLEHAPDPIALIDAIVQHDLAVEDVYSIGAGVMEDFLQWRPECWEMVADRCTSNSVWARAVSGAWLHDTIREQLPPRLSELIPSVFEPVEESRRSRRAREKAERKARTRKSWNGRTAPRGLRGTGPGAADLDLLLAALHRLDSTFADPSSLGATDDDAAWADLALTTATDGLGDAMITQSASADALDLCAELLDRTGSTPLSPEAEQAVREVAAGVRRLAERSAHAEEGPAESSDRTRERDPGREGS